MLPSDRPPFVWNPSFKMDMYGTLISAKNKLEPKSFESIGTDRSFTMSVSIKFELRLDRLGPFFKFRQNKLKIPVCFYFRRKTLKQKLKSIFDHDFLIIIHSYSSWKRICNFSWIAAFQRLQQFFLQMFLRCLRKHLEMITGYLPSIIRWFWFFPILPLIWPFGTRIDLKWNKSCTVVQ